MANLFVSWTQKLRCLYILISLNDWWIYLHFGFLDQLNDWWIYLHGTPVALTRLWPTFISPLTHGKKKHLSALSPTQLFHHFHSDQFMLGSIILLSQSEMQQCGLHVKIVKTFLHFPIDGGAEFCRRETFSMLDSN